MIQDQRRGRHQRRGWRRGPGDPLNFLYPYLLLLLHHQPFHGYALLEQLADLGVNVDSLNPGLVYRALGEMEAKQYLTSEWDSRSLGPPRRVYRLTPEGEQRLAQWIEELREASRTLKHFIDAYEAHIESHEQLEKGGE